MDESLWPARNVAEHAYCPRLFYYMQVEGIFVPSSDTEKGAAVHRRVDKPSAALEKVDESEADPDRPRIVRSLALTSESLGLTATLRRPLGCARFALLGKKCVLATCFCPSAINIFSRRSRSALICFSIASRIASGGMMFFTSTRFTLMPHG